MSYSSYKRKERDKIERDLLKDIDTLECNVNQASIQLLENKKQDLENIRNEKIKGKIIRSKVQWIKEGGKPTKCFCGLESNIFTSKIIPKIERNDGKTINKQFAYSLKVVWRLGLHYILKCQYLSINLFLFYLFLFSCSLNKK
jgi:hypothetical protein